MLAAEDSAKFSSIVDEVRALKERVDTLEEQLQALIDLHTKAYEIREDYLEHLDEIEQRGDFQEFSDIDYLKRLIDGRPVALTPSIWTSVSCTPR